MLPFRRNQPYSEDAIDRAAAAIVTNLQERGFYNATVDTEESLQGNVWTSTFHVNPGQQFHLDGGHVHRQRQDLRQDAARRRRDVAARRHQGTARHDPSPSARRHARTDRRRPHHARVVLPSAADSPTATVATPVVNTNAATGAMTIDFPITEGPQTMVAVGRDRRKRAGRDEGSAEADAEGRRRAESDSSSATTSSRCRRSTPIAATPRCRCTCARKSAPTRRRRRVVYIDRRGAEDRASATSSCAATRTRRRTSCARTAALEKGRAVQLHVDPRSAAAICIASASSSASTSSRRRPATGVADAQHHHLGRRGEGPHRRRLARRHGADQRQHRHQPHLAARLRIDRAPQSLRHRPLSRPGADLRARRIGRTRSSPIASRSSAGSICRFRSPRSRATTSARNAHRAARRIHRSHARRALSDALVAALRIPHRQVQGRARSGRPLRARADRCSCRASIATPRTWPSPASRRRSSGTNATIRSIRIAASSRRRSVEYAFPLIAANARFLKEFTQTSWYLPVSERSTFAVSGRVGLIQDLGVGTTIDPDTGSHSDERRAAVRALHVRRRHVAPRLRARSPRHRLSDAAVDR